MARRLGSGGHRCKFIFVIFAVARGFSDGGRGPPPDGDDGTPLIQTCDAIGLCNIPDTATDAITAYRCPDGMSAVAPPVRSPVYVLGTEDGATSYTPGKLVPLTLRVTQKQIMGKRDRGTANSGNESSKYIGIAGLPFQIHRCLPTDKLARVVTCVSRSAVVRRARRRRGRAQSGHLGDTGRGSAKVLAPYGRGLRRARPHACKRLTEGVCGAIQLPGAGRGIRPAHLPHADQAWRH